MRRASAHVANPEAELRRTRFILACVILGAAWSFASSFLGGGWVSASAIVASITLFDIAFIYHYRDALLAKLFIFGLAAGFVELLADWWLVTVTGTLVYAEGGPFVLSSPLYMPFAWGNLVAALGYFGLRMADQWSMPVAVLAMSMAGAIYIPAHEQWAAGAGWWIYRNTPMLGAAPLFIIVGEFLLVLVVPWATRLVLRSHPVWVTGIGAGVGLWIWAAYAIAFILFT